MSFVQTQYLPSNTQEWNEGICIGLGFFGLGDKSCSSYADQTLTQVDVLGSIAANWLGDAPTENWNPAAYTDWYSLQIEHISIVKLGLIFLSLIIIPEIYIFKKKYNLSIF